LSLWTNGCLMGFVFVEIFVMHNECLMKCLNGWVFDEMFECMSSVVICL
jgi:hypothetical protein